MNASRSAKGAPRANCDRQPEPMYQPDGDRRLEAASGISGDGVEARRFDLSERPEVHNRESREKLKRMLRLIRKNRDEWPRCVTCFMHCMDLGRGLDRPLVPHECRDDYADVLSKISESQQCQANKSSNRNSMRYKELRGARVFILKNQAPQAWFTAEQALTWWRESSVAPQSLHGSRRYLAGLVRIGVLRTHYRNEQCKIGAVLHYQFV